MRSRADSDVLAWNTAGHGCEEEITPFDPEIVNIIVIFEDVLVICTFKVSLFVQPDFLIENTTKKVASL